MYRSFVYLLRHLHIDSSREPDVFFCLRMRMEERKEKYVWPNTPGFRFRLECDNVITGGGN